MGQLKFASKKNSNSNKEKWKVLIVDDEPAVHTMTKTVLSQFKLDDKELEFFDAYSGEEAIELLKEKKDIQVILLDVVMETEDAGLITTQRIREELNNHLVRIVLRTGNPGSAPEQEVILKYRINDYKEKTELTSKKLFSTLVTALRSYEDLYTIEKNKQGLEKIINGTKSILKARSLEVFAEGVLTQLTSLLNLNDDSLILNTNSLSLQKNKNDYDVLASVGEYENINSFSEVKDEVKDLISQTIEKKQSQFYDNAYVGYFSFNELIYIVYISTNGKIDNTDKRLTEIFSNNISIAFYNMLLDQDIIDTQKEIIEKLGEVVEIRSNEASKHVHRVAELSYNLALDYGLEEKDAELLRMGSPMHDVGKIGIPDGILLKPGKLTSEEYEVMKTHAQIGYDMLKASSRDILKTAAIISYEHHEKWDGTGYPRGLKGDEIHIYGRITTMADVFDALYHERCYKKAWPINEILDFFKEESGKQFDPKLVDLIFENTDKYVKILNIK